MTDWKTGQIILKEYLIEKELGRGGMGKVWLVKSGTTGRKFAVKQTLVKDEKNRKAFLAELQTWIDLPEHPNILPCRFFRTASDEIIIFTDYMEGGSLADWIAKRKLTKVEQILDVAIQFAWGLHAIHERGLVHQDVKPGNVLMTADGIPKLADFGLARARMRAGNSVVMPLAAPLEQKGFWAGLKRAMDARTPPPLPFRAEGSRLLVSMGGMTPAYASPEQKAGQPLSCKTDIWSWGVSVLDMFMGELSCPHGGHIAAEMLASFLEEGQQEKGLPKMPEAVSNILRKCFARVPDERWEHLEVASRELVHVLEGVTGKESGRLHATNRRLSSQLTVKHDRQMKGGQWIEPREWLRVAYEVVGENPDKADIFQPPAAYTRKGAGVSELAIYEEAEKLFQQAIRNGNDNGRENSAHLYLDKALIYLSLDDSSGAMQSYDQAIAIYQRLVEEGRSEIATLLALAYMNYANDQIMRLELV
jgi:serine/threonine protein kinase